MGLFDTGSLTNTKATNPKGTWDNFKHNAEQFVIRILLFIAAVILAVIIIKLTIRAVKAAERSKLTAEIGELQAELQVAKEFGGAAGAAGFGVPSGAGLVPPQPQIVYVQAPPQIVYAQPPTLPPTQFAAP